MSTSDKQARRKSYRLVRDHDVTVMWTHEEIPDRWPILRAELLGHLAVLPMTLSPQGRLLALRHAVAEFTAAHQDAP